MSNYMKEKQQVIKCLEQFNTKQEKPSEVLFNVYPAEMNAIVRLVKNCKKESVNQQRELLIDYHRNLIINEEYANLLSDVKIEVDRYLKTK